MDKLRKIRKVARSRPTVEEGMTRPARPLRPCLPAAVLLLGLSLPGCSFSRSVAASFRSTDHFLPLATDGRVLHETGAEEWASAIAPLLPAAVALVEEALGRPFAEPVRIHVCATDESCRRLTGQRAPATVTDKLFLAPRLFREKRPLDRYLAHELTHLHMRQSLGAYKMAKLPAWFREGVAEVVSGGATASRIGEVEALAALKAGRGFHPDTDRWPLSSILFPRGASYWDLEQPMYYRQCMLFAAYLRDSRPEAFRGLLSSVREGRSLKSALAEHYKAPVTTLWNDFLKTIPADLEGRGGGGRP